MIDFCDCKGAELLRSEIVVIMAYGHPRQQ